MLITTRQIMFFGAWIVLSPQGAQGVTQRGQGNPFMVG